MRDSYREIMERVLGELISPECTDLDACLPVIKTGQLREPPFYFSLLFCCRYRKGVVPFFCEMIRKGALPGRRLEIPLQFSFDFSRGVLKYVAGEVCLYVETVEELEKIRAALPSLEREIRLGLDSDYLADRLLEGKGLNLDQKRQVMEEHIANLIKRRPQDFDYDLYTELQHFLVLSQKRFREERSCRQMSRIVCTHYLFRKALKVASETFPERRYISVKVTRISTHLLGVILAMSFLRENEVFEERHFLNACALVLPGIRGGEGSFFAGRGERRTYYCEIEKESGLPFTQEEISLLKEELPSRLKGGIEERMNPLFMPENEEEILRHILTLSGQVKYVRDLPQAVIHFHKQTQEDLEFLVVMVRVCTSSSRSLRELFERKTSQVKVLQNRTKVIGRLRNKHEKVADIFRLKIEKAPFLRRDHSIDLYKARGQVAEEMVKLIGDFRDFNGGIISKEGELFHTLKTLLGPLSQEEAFLLENFFFALHPPVMRSVLHAHPIKKLFYMLRKAEQLDRESRSATHFLLQEEEGAFYLLLAFADSTCRGVLEEALRTLNIPSLQLAWAFVEGTESHYLGVIYQNGTRAQSMALQSALENAMEVTF